MRRRRQVFYLALFLTGMAGASAADVGLVFENNCAACHGTDGKANTPRGRKLKAKNLRTSQLTDAEIERQIREGSKNKSGSTTMPAFGRDLTEAQIQEAIATVKSFRNPAAKE